MKKTWENPTIETVEISATATDFMEKGNDGGFFDLVQGEGDYVWECES